MIEIKKAVIADVKGIVGIHNNAFPDFFLTKLGNNFLRLYYESMCKCKGAVTLCVVEDGNVLGFSTTAIKSAGFNTKLIKDNFVGFILEALKLLFTNPMSLIHLAKNMSKTNSDIEDKGDYAELFSIGVSPDCQGKGVGSMLLTETERIISSKGVNQLSLTTDKYNNDSTIAFYKKNGYEVMYEFDAYPDREMIRYIKTLKR